MNSVPSDWRQPGSRKCFDAGRSRAGRTASPRRFADFLADQGAKLQSLGVACAAQMLWPDHPRGSAGKLAK